jgi:multidrug efflux pump subunit AcrB
MNFSAWSIRNPVAAIVLFILLTGAGLFAFGQMKIQNFPDIELPLVSVTTTWPGASPEQIETDLARKLENAFATIVGVKHIYTKLYDGLAVINVEFQLEKPLQEGQEDVRSAVSKVRSELPGGINEPIVTKLDLASSPVLAFTVSAPDAQQWDTQALSWFVDHELTRRLLTVKGVGAVRRVGGVNREITVELDPYQMQALRVSAAEVSRQLALINIERAGGRAKIGGFEQPLHTLAAQGSAQEIAALPISLSDGRRIVLRDVARVRDGYAEPSSAAFLDGRPVIGFEVSRSRGESEVDIAAGARTVLAGLEKENPQLRFTQSFDFVTPVIEEYHASLLLLYEGALLAVLVVWLFLRDIRATAVSAVALPLAAIPAFAGMLLMGFTINVVTLLAISLVIGVLVDDAIVEVENIVRHMRMGKTPFQAALEAADEIGLAVIATTFTLISVFLPTSFMPGVVGRVFRNFGWTAVLAIFASLLVARLLTPMMAAYWLRAQEAPPAPSPASPAKARGWRRLMQRLSTHSPDIGWMPPYLRMVRWSMSHPWTIIMLAALFFVATTALVAFLPKGFMTPDDNSQTQIYVQLPPGATLAQTQATAEEARRLLMDNPHVRSVYTTIGGGSAGGDPFNGSPGETRLAVLTVQLDPRGQRPRKQIIERAIREQMSQLAGVRVKVGLGGSGEKFIMSLSSDNPEQLVRTAQAIAQDLRTISGIGNVDSSLALVRNEIAVIPDLYRAATLGVTATDIAETLRVATRGDYDTLLPKLSLPSRQIPIVIRLKESAYASREELSRLLIPGARGPVMLGQVAQLRYGGGASLIERLDRQRNVTFNVELADMALGDMQEKVAQLPSIRHMPSGVQRLEIGDAEAQAEMGQGFANAMLIGLLCIYCVLVLLFRAFWHPITILAALPLSFGGAFIALLLAGQTLSMPALIGLLMLMGIATKNSILLVDYAIMAQRERALSLADAMLDACAKRARPIIMTSLAMGAGMLPVAIGSSSADPSFRSPMAVAVIGGLVTSTLLSLLVIPPAFMLMDQAAGWLRRKMPK